MFDPRNPLANNRDCDRVRDRCESSNIPPNFDTNSVKNMPQEYEIRDNISYGEPLQFRTQHTKDDESGSSSPPLWKTSPPRNQFHSRSHNQHHDFRSLSPSSRTQAIVRGQREMMEMVKNMPESCYELSMKDLVEYSQEEEIQEQCLIQDKDQDDDDDDEQQQQQPQQQQQRQVVQQQQRVKVKRQASNNKAKMVRSESIDNRGLFLKMVFPVTFRSKKKKKNSTNVSTISSKVSPKPEVLEKSSKGVDKDWWKRRFSNANESSDGVTTSSSSGSSGSSGSSSSSIKSSRNSTRKARQMMNKDSSKQCRKGHGLLKNCCFCFQSRKDKSAD